MSSRCDAMPETSGGAAETSGGAHESKPSMRTFVFPGQGSQLPGMGAAFVGHPAWSLVEQASDACGRDVGHLLTAADADELRATRNAQLGTFVQSMLVLEGLRAAGVSFDAVAGHSLGEYSALCAAGVVDFAGAVRLVAERGEAMQVAAAETVGTMAAVLGLDTASVEAVCDKVTTERQATGSGGAAGGAGVWVANDNAPGQVVIAGAPDVVTAAAELAKEAGAKRVMGLEVSGAFHTPLMAPAAERLAAAIAATTWADAAVPVVANVDAAVHTSAADWPDLLNRQLTSPVRWTQSVETLVALGTTTVVEAGPGAVLVGTVKRIAGAVGRHSAMTPAEIDAVAAALGAAP